jgi:hypothetical protein
MKTILLSIALIIISTLSFAGCTPAGDQTTYGNSNVWMGYVYSGIAFNRYKGYVNEGVSASPGFDESFGGASVKYATNGCSILTDTFSVRYKLTSTFADGDYVFTVGGDDGYRFSLDGGVTWSVNMWNNQSYVATTYTVHLNGTYNLVIEYFEKFLDNRISFDVVKASTGGSNRASFNVSSGATLAIALINFKGIYGDQQVDLSWATMMESGVDHYEIERSGDGMNFLDIDQVESKMTISTNDFQLNYQFTDTHPLMGTSFYRVKVVGKNGAVNQTAVIEINNSPVIGTRIYPTVVRNNMLYVESDKTLREVKMEFFDLSGNKISETNWSSLNGRQNVRVSKAGGLPTGTYVARLTANGQNVKSQLVIVHNF